MSFDRQYFSRQLSLDGFGAAAQRRLARSHVVVAGLGGTGSVVATNLCLAGVGRMTLVDRDVVSTENLHRQPAYSLGDVGKAKAEVMSDFLLSRNRATRVDYHVDSLDRENAKRLVSTADVAVDCLDNLPARLALNGACVERSVPLVHTGAAGWDASMGAFWSPRSACLECLFPSAAEDPMPSCEEAGILGAIASQVASAGSLEALKILARLPPSYVGRMMFLDARTGETRTISIAKRPDCGACGRSPSPTKEPSLVQLCGGREFYVARAFNPRSFTKITRSFGGAVRLGESVATARLGQLNISLFKSGGMLVKGASSPQDVDRALRELRSIDG